MLATKNKYLIGVDEAGRGPLAGPVAVGVVCIAKDNFTKCKKLFAGAKDCKQLSPAQRETWFAKIKQAQKRGDLDYAVSLSAHSIIDEWGIVTAIKQAMSRALRRLDLSPDQVTVKLDGSLRAPKIYSNQQTIIRGDESEMIIALASIVAKVRRDRHMVRLAKQYPEYNFEIHKGYGTKSHYQALKKNGLCDIHRRSFLTRIV